MLRELGVGCAMDVSDGLTADLGKLCSASGVSAVVEVERLPADRYLKDAFPERWREFALGGGEDYEIVFTVDADMMERVKERLGEGVSVIGRIEEESGHPHPSPLPSRERGLSRPSPREREFSQSSSGERGLSRPAAVKIVDSDGNEIVVGSGGWDHFAGQHG